MCVDGAKEDLYILGSGCYGLEPEQLLRDSIGDWTRDPQGFYSKHVLSAEQLKSDTNQQIPGVTQCFFGRSIKNLFVK